MRRYLIRILWLSGAWVALWGDVTAANVLAGVLVGALLVALFPPADEPRSAFRLLAALRFAGYFTGKLVEASAIVAWEVVTPTSRINEGIVAVPIRGVSRGLTAVVANAITLTPGTITLEVREDPTVLYVHVLHLRSLEAVRAEVLRLEELAIAAFGVVPDRPVAPAGEHR